MQSSRREGMRSSPQQVRKPWRPGDRPVTAHAPTLADAAAGIGVRNPRVLQAMREVSRGAFVPPEYRDVAERDEPVPIGHGQVTTQPSLVAVMVEALGLEGTETVLEVGTGYGYQTALLSRLARFVWSVERWPDLATAARANLEAQGIANVEVVVGDGTVGLPECAPFDGVVVAAAFPRVPPPLADQLRPGGRLVQPVGRGGAEEVMLFQKDDALRASQVLIPARFVRLIGEHGFPG